MQASWDGYEQLISVLSSSVVDRTPIESVPIIEVLDIPRLINNQSYRHLLNIENSKLATQ